METTLQLTGGHRNLVGAFADTARQHAHAPALSWMGPGQKVRSLSWGDYLDTAARMAAGLVSVGVKPGDRVGILSENRFEWLVADMGILAAGAVTVAPHAPLTAKQVQFQLQDAGVSWLFVSNAEQLSKIDSVRSELPDLRGVVGFDLPTHRSDVEPWESFLRRGRGDSGTLATNTANLALEDLAGILYTSGTTGNPKGVMLTHANILSNSHAMLGMCPVASDDLLLSWLPYTHIYARTVDHYKAILSGLHLFLAPSSDVVPALLSVVQPTHMSSVPRLYEKILTALDEGNEEQTAAKLRELFGSRRKWFSSGGAPLPPAIAERYRQAGVLVLQGYGLTETSPVITFNRPDAYRLDTVGQPIPGVEVSIAPDGEILTRGPHLMKGYWRNPTATAEMIRDGWLYTGDIGELTSEGFLKITGRKKEMMVLSNGKKIAPSTIEGALICDPCIEQVVICGEGRSYLTALIVPSWDAVRRELAGRLPDEAPAALTTHPEVERLLRARIDLALCNFSSGEQVRRFVVLAEPFSVAREELTVSLKLRRKVVLERYAEALAALYARGGEVCG
jgi:long-chain acyl-CoA synthetase